MLKKVSFLGLTPWVVLMFSACATKPITPTVSLKEDTFAWISMGPDAKVFAKFMTPATSCPRIKLDSREVEMNLRVSPSDQFPIHVCETEIPAQTRQILIEGQALQPPKKSPKRIVILGDTGCRVKVTPKGDFIQDCDDPQSWPFAKIARSAAAWKPDLVIHVGDYLYRESECPKGNTGCKGSPYGDRWSTWKSDFFKPSSSLLAAAPWVFVRGNHELCERGGEGWFRFLAQGPYPDSCQDSTEPYTISAGRLNFFVLDSALAHDEKVIQDQVKIYQTQLKKLKSLKKSSWWLLTHKPVWGVAGPWSQKTAKEQPHLLFNSVLQKAIEHNLSASLDLVVAGHIHLFESLTFSDRGPSQLVVGSGGTELAVVPAELSSVKVGGRKIKQGVALHDFGYLALEWGEKKHQWDATLYDPEGKSLQQCVIRGRQLRCDQG